MSSTVLLPVILSLLCAGLCVVCYVLWQRLSGAQARATEAELALARAALATGELERLTAEMNQYREEIETWRTSAHKAETSARVLEEKLRAAEAAKQEEAQLKQQFEQYAKAAALAAGSEISSKLLADHQREREQAVTQQKTERETTYKQFEQFTKTATEHLLQRQVELVQTLGKMQGQIDLSTSQLNVLVRAMKNPIGAGAEGEIMLDNLLKQLGLQPGIDYQLQVHVNGEEQAFRPDGVIFLPNDQAIIVDAKASQHIYALYEAEGTEAYEAVFAKLCASMWAHVKALSTKNYRAEIARWMKQQKRGEARVMLVMFVPNDEIVTRLRQREPELIAEMARYEIMLAGPATLPSICMVAATMIREARQKDEQHAILELTAALMSDVITALKKAEKVIGGIRTSARAFDEFAASINSGVIRRLQRIQAKGVQPAKNQPLPSNLPRFDITKVDEVIAGEAVELTEVMMIEEKEAV